MSVITRAHLGRVTGGLLVAVGLAGLGGGVANAAEDGTIQEVGHASHQVDEETGVAQTEKHVDDATGVTQIDDELGVTKAEEGLGMG